MADSIGMGGSGEKWEESNSLLIGGRRELGGGE